LADLLYLTSSIWTCRRTDASPVGNPKHAVPGSLFRTAKLGQNRPAAATKELLSQPSYFFRPHVLPPAMLRGRRADFSTRKRLNPMGRLGPALSWRRNHGTRKASGGIDAGGDLKARCGPSRRFPGSNPVKCPAAERMCGTNPKIF
jgi:hypothetical protein